MAGIDFAKDRIFSQTVSGRPKSEVLHALAAKHPDAAGKVFVEDKLSTLEKVRGIVLTAVPTPWAISQPADLLLPHPIPITAGKGPLLLSLLTGEQGLLSGLLATVPRGLGLQHGGGEAACGCQPAHPGH